MKTFTKFFALLFAFTIMGSMNLNAQNPAWSDPNGDATAPLLEIWIYGATVGVTPLEHGDQIAAFDGEKLVGLMTLNIQAPATQIDETNWISNKLVVYSKDASGNDLYQPGNPIILRAWDGSVDTWWAHTWYEETPGNPNNGHIQFHNDWYAPIGDTSGFANIGAFFPKEDEYGFCYVSLDFETGGATFSYQSDIDFKVTAADGTTNIKDVTLTSAGYTGITNIDGEVNIQVYWNAGTITYDFIVEHDDYETEMVSVDVAAAGNIGPAVSVKMNSWGVVSGHVEHNPADGGGPINTPGAAITATVNGVTRTASTDVGGNYSIDSVPDGTCTITAFYPGYDIETITDDVQGNGVGLDNQDFSLIPVQGIVEGEIFDATTLELIIVDPTFKLSGHVLGVGEISFDGTGGYEIDYTAGTYDLTIILANYETYVQEGFIIDASTSRTENFNLLPDSHSPVFAEVTGNPNMLWSIHIQSARFGSSSMLPYDELAIYNDKSTALVDDDVLVGSIDLTKSAIYQNSGYNVLKAFAQDNTGTTLFSEGESFIFKAFDVSHGNELADTTSVPVNWLFTPNMGTYQGTTFPDPAENHVSYLEVYWDSPDGILRGTVTDDATPHVALGDVTVEVLNIFTQEVVATGTTDVNGQFTIGLDQGTYKVKFSKDDYATQTVVDVVVVNGEVTDMGQITLAARAKATQAYSFTGPNYYFFGRCVERPTDAMISLINSNGAPGTFSTECRNSWIENDQVFIPAAVDYHFEFAGGWTPNDYKWELIEGYQLFIHDNDPNTAPSGSYDFNLGDQYLVEPEDNPITLDAAGIYYVPYFPYTYAAPDDAIDAFASILGSIDWVMDQDGNRLHKDNGNWIDNIGEMSPEQGYKVKTTESTTLTYPAEASKSHKGSRVMLDPVHYVYNEGNAAEWTYTMYINTDDFDIGDEIAAYSNGVMVGSMVIDSDLAWENDLNTFFAAVESGYEISSDIELMAWDVSEGNDYYVEFEMVPEVADAYIGTKYPAGLDHFSYVNLYRGTVRVDENQINNDIRVYPNPTSHMVNIESVSNINTINIYNIHGALIDIVTVNSTTQSVNVENFASGTYLIQMNTDTGVITKRILVK